MAKKVQNGIMLTSIIKFPQTHFKTTRNDDIVKFSVEDKSLSDKVKLLIIRDLWNLGWSIDIADNTINIQPPQEYDKQTIRYAMSLKRVEIIEKHRKWIDSLMPLAKANLAKGSEVLSSGIEPYIEVCQTKKQHELFRIFRYYWSSPYSEYVGRRIRLIIRDYALPSKPVIGIAALGSPIIHIPERDLWIGWNKEVRTKNLVYTMDAYVIGALPPYNFLLGGKLISYLLASKEVREIYYNKYKDQVTLIDKRKVSELAGLFTTSLYGRSSQYNRLKYNGELLYIPIGETKGYGTLHISEETIKAMRELLISEGIFINNRFGDGPSWIMRVIRSTADLLGFNSDVLLKHSFKRCIYFIPLASNFRDFLNDRVKSLDYFNYTVNELTTHWKERWLDNRLKNEEVILKVRNYIPDDFHL